MQCLDGVCLDARDQVRVTLHLAGVSPSLLESPAVRAAMRVTIAEALQVDAAAVLLTAVAEAPATDPNGAGSMVWVLVLQPAGAASQVATRLADAIAEAEAPGGLAHKLRSRGVPLATAALSASVAPRVVDGTTSSPPEGDSSGTLSLVTVVIIAAATLLALVAAGAIAYAAHGRRRMRVLHASKAQLPQAPGSGSPRRRAVRGGSAVMAAPGAINSPGNDTEHLQGSADSKLGKGGPGDSDDDGGGSQAESHQYFDNPMRRGVHSK